MSKGTTPSDIAATRFTRRRLLATTGALVAVSACATAPVGAPSPTPATGGAAPAPGAPATVKLTAWTIGPDAPSYYRRDNLISAVDILNKKIAAENKKVEVDATFESGGQWGDYLQKFTLAAEAKTAPDIVLAGHENFAPWVGPGYVIALDDLIKKYQNEGGVKDVIPTLWDAMKLKGKTYAVPQDTEARPMYYRKDLLAKLGWSKDKIDGLPEAVKKGEWTWSDLVATAKEAISKNVVETGSGWYHRPSKGADFYGYYYLFGGQMQDGASGKLVLVKGAFEQYFKMHADAVVADKITPRAVYGMAGKQWHETVTAGKVLFYNAGTWTWKDWQATYKVPEQSLWDNVGFMLIPAATKGGKPSTLSHPLAYMVTGNAKDPDAAFRLIANATTPELNSRHSVESAHSAILTTQTKDPTYSKDKFLLATSYMQEFTHFIPNHPKFGPYDDVLYRLLGAVEGGQMTPSQAVSTAVSELQGQLGDDLIVK
ncbi:MAG TPA: extracellular solute-binding protein [Candidatus Limnocylindria bacterium]|nr:extracellular solute-binding protein [Candidatus Limnocylindria bacterium]